MAFELLAPNFTAGLEADVAKTQATLQFLASLATPTTETVMRTAMELGQIQPYSNDGWNALMGQLSNVTLNETALTAQERSIINVIRQVVTPDPSLDCCGVAVPVSALTVISAYPWVGSATWQHQLELKLLDTTDCNVKSVTVAMTPIGIAPAITSANPATVTFKRCYQDGRFFSFFYMTFATDPTGESYSLVLDFLDADGISITSFAPAYNLNIS